jgi:hypothetical protein
MEVISLLFSNGVVAKSISKKATDTVWHTFVVRLITLRLDLVGAKRQGTAGEIFHKWQ